VKQSWLENGFVYGYRTVWQDLYELGEICGVNRVHRLMALRLRQPKQAVMVHSDQGSQFSSYDWQDFFKEHNLQQSMSPCGNCHCNAVAKSLFQLLKRERVR
jgi:transposase InsO family protein